MDPISNAITFTDSDTNT